MPRPTTPVPRAALDDSAVSAHGGGHARAGHPAHRGRRLGRHGAITAVVLLGAAVLARGAASAKGSATASAKAQPGSVPVDAGPALDLGETRDKLLLLSDSKDHFIAVVPFGDLFDAFYYGDGKVFWAQRVGSGANDGTTSFRRSFWEPRVSAPWKASFAFSNGEYTLQCDDRKTTFTPLPAEDGAAMVKAATFYGARWKYRAYALARDTSGRYYYVDRPRQPEGSLAFRLFVGPRGNMKPQKMTNVVSDSEGDIFATKTGSLRLILDKHETTWVQGKRKTPLVTLPLDQNAALIYTDLGPYTGQRLGTPCDDL